MYGDNLGIRGLTHVSLLLVRLVGVVLEPVVYTISTVGSKQS